MSKRMTNALWGTAALISGFLLYILFREKSYIAELFTGSFAVISLRQLLLPYCGGFVRFYFGDFLWGVALGCYLRMLFPYGRLGTLICAAVSFAAGTVWELMQLLEVASGTADAIDVLMYFSASILLILINKRRETNEKV